ncbi:MULTISPECIES: FAD-dependent monooxygenase [unclassified Rhizobium]|uniref:FAD-dependent monooxygenase n=1 Tax=unclassified Rhizobium TaxID=2613769 RepID=UPI000DDD5FA3|nr:MULTISPECIES: FAD-dependent monooxygenase [unclassified Rhizobium]MBB3288906.1 salicylate hydroxylase [Rhizobium sp. BK252]MBB3403648.1 salicylate hydroxylase [Rhizobium sp. BK289]MBB3416167.1 salicylate hydroxylase [Rhizobium sp. BK284]MBB3484111.1 salicylate hydroxylase [Rhizobium sp. BK347]MDK4720224.1 FAD-dependent monooxygenase [Rhizobium sp. CNPSo 3968]
MPVKRAAIVGAGIAGLTAALALARHGIESDIFEQAGALTEVGAGLQISPNASRILDTLGVLDALRPVWLEPDEVRLVSGSSLRQIASVPCGNFARHRWGAPYGTAHRATLQKALLEAVAANALCRLHLGRRIDIEDQAIPDAIADRDFDLVIGADGVWSKTRAFVPGAPSPLFSGNIAWRFTMPEASAPSILNRTSVTAFLGRSSHLVCYPIRENAAFNMVAIVSGSSASHDWNATGSKVQRESMLRGFSGWNDAILHMLERQEQASFWPLYEMGAGRWHNGKDTILIGDAAHAMMPFAAQGAAMAIEDAFELAGMLATRPLAEAFDLYEKHRAPRIARLRQRAAFNQFAYHARGPIRMARDLVLSFRPPQSLAADMDWIYGYRAIG